MFVGVVALRYQHHTTESENTRHFHWSCPLAGNASCVFKTQTLQPQIITANFLTGVARVDIQTATITMKRCE